MRISSRKGYFALLGVLLWLVIMSVLLSLIWGQLSMDVTEVIASITHYFGFMILPDTVPTAQQEAVLWHIRLPRTLVGLLVGASLAASGAVLQGVFSNPLADPGIIGVSSGASVGAIVAIAGGFATAYSLALPAFAFLGAISAMGLAVALSLHHGRIPVMTLLLSGVVVGMFLSAVTAVILTSLSNQQMQQYLFWTIGDLDYRRWEHVFLGVVPISAGIFLMLLMSRQLNVLMLGEVAARAVGMPVMHWRILFLSLAALTTAAAVCISGNIGFVGLVVPHAMRLLVGPDHRRLLPASILAGAAFLVLCDSVGRIILPSSEIRVGIMTAFIGTPYFLYLLRKRRI